MPAYRITTKQGPEFVSGTREDAEFVAAFWSKRRDDKCSVSEVDGADLDGFAYMLADIIISGDDEMMIAYQARE